VEPATERDRFCAPFTVELTISPEPEVNEKSRGPEAIVTESRGAGAAEPILIDFALEIFMPLTGSRASKARLPSKAESEPPEATLTLRLNVRSPEASDWDMPEERERVSLNVVGPIESIEIAEAEPEPAPIAVVKPTGALKIVEPSTERDRFCAPSTVELRRSSEPKFSEKARGPEEIVMESRGAGAVDPILIGFALEIMIPLTGSRASKARLPSKTESIGEAPPAATEISRLKVVPPLKSVWRNPFAVDTVSLKR
jgi:hypothetical protein